MNLFDTIKKNMANASQPINTQATEQNITGQAQKLLQAKSGKAVAPQAAPRVSNIGEQLANQQTQIAQGQLAQQVALGTEQLQQAQQAQQQQLQLAQQQAQFQQQKVESDFLRNEETLVDQYAQGVKKLNLQKDKGKFEQVGFKLRMQNQSYMDNLKREAQRSQLDNELRFKEEMARTIFAEEHDLFQDDLDFRSAIFGDKLAFNEQMAQLSLDQAVEMAQMANQQAAANSMFTGIGSLVSGGAGLYAARQKKLKADEEAKKSDTTSGFTGSTTVADTSNSDDF